MNNCKNISANVEKLC